MNRFYLLSFIIININLFLSCYALNKTFIEEVAKPTSEAFRNCSFKVLASEWSCLSDASKEWQVELEEITVSAPNNRKKCCAFWQASECIQLKVNQACVQEGKQSYLKYHHDLIDYYGDKGCKIFGENYTICNSSNPLHQFNSKHFLIYFVMFVILICHLFNEFNVV